MKEETLKEAQEFIKENSWKTLKAVKNWKDIVTSFDDVEEVLLQPNGKSLRIKGKKDGSGADMYVDYVNKEVAKEVLNKIKATIK